MLTYIYNNPSPFVALISLLIGPIISKVLTEWIDKSKSSELVWFTSDTRTLKQEIDGSAYASRIQSIYIRRSFLTNTGTIKIILSHRPENLSVTPACHYSENLNPDGKYVIELQHMPETEITLSFWSIKKTNFILDLIPSVLSISSSDAVCREIRTKIVEDRIIKKNRAFEALYYIAPPVFMFLVVFIFAKAL